MTQPTGYSNFVYGKLVDRNSGYCIVARTADLVDEDQLLDIAEKTHYFWNQPPDGAKPKGVGVFQVNDQIVFAQFSRALNDQEQEVASGGSRFYQHRYVFIPRQSLDALHHQTPFILSWLNQQRISIFKEFDCNLQPLSIPPIDSSTVDLTSVANKVQRLWSETNDEGEPLLLSALAALINRQRLILARDPEASIVPEVFLESLISLLPASCRSQIAIAVGSIEEEDCTWAQLIIKNRLPGRQSLTSDSHPLIWLDLAQKTFVGDCQSNVFQHPYVDDTLLPLKSTPEAIERRLQNLDQACDTNFNLESLSQPEFIVQFIPELPEERQTELWKKYIARITPERWQVIISAISDPQALASLWIALHQRNPHEKSLIALLVLVWEKLSPQAQVKFFESHLESNLELTETLLLNGLLEPLEHESSEIRAMLKQLCQALIAKKAKQNIDSALHLVEQLTDLSALQESGEAFKLMDTIFSEQIAPDALEKIFITKIFPLVPTFHPSQWQESSLRRRLTTSASKIAAIVDRLDQLIQRQPEALKQIVYIADRLGMNPSLQDPIISCFLESWGLPFESTKPFLKLLIERSLAGSKFTQQQFSASFRWFKAQEPQLVQALDRLEQHPDEWNNWTRLAALMCDTTQTEICFLEQVVESQMKSMDQPRGQSFLLELLQKWLSINDQTYPSKVGLLSRTIWADLQPDLLSRLLARQPHVEVLAHAFLQVGRQDLIQGDLIHSLTHYWLEHQKAEPSLVTLISRSNILQQLSGSDRLKLQHAAWQLELNLRLPVSSLSLIEKQQLYRDAIAVIELPCRFETAQQLLRDCHAWGLEINEKKRIATKLAALCTLPAQVRQVMETCVDIGCDPRSQQEILSQAKPEACTTDLVLLHLPSPQNINLERDRSLLQLLLKTQPQSDAEKISFKNFFTQFFINWILDNRTPNDLQELKVQSANSQLYEDAFAEACQQLTHDPSFISPLQRLLLDYARRTPLVHERQSIHHSLSNIFDTIL
jgi:hypothetical protein